MDEEAFAALTAAADPAMVVVTTAVEGEQAGCLVGFHAQASISAAHYCLWLSKANHTYRVGLRATHFAIHFPTTRDLDLATRFGTRSGQDEDKFAGLEISADESGVPLLEALPHRMLVERLTLLDDGGDHVCITATVRSARSSGRFAPLRLSDVAHLQAGHAAEERAIQP